MSNLNIDINIIERYNNLLKIKFEKTQYPFDEFNKKKIIFTKNQVQIEYKITGGNSEGCVEYVDFLV